MKKIAALSLAVCISLSLTTTSNAGSLRDFTDSVYRSFTTSGGPDNFRSTSGDSVYTGGAYSLRFGVDDVKLIDFKPPSVSASCSGIDFFAGSIGFGSRDEVIQLGRNIAAAATVYAFKLALNSVCPSCAAIMQNIQAWVEKLNALANMTCQDALDIMEEAGKEEESETPSDKKWEIFGQKVDGWADPEEFMAKDTKPSYFEQIIAKGIELATISEKTPELIPDLTDMGYFIAYNTDLPKHLFPYLDEDLQKMATWSIISTGKKCANVQLKQSDGAYCGVPDSELVHDYSSFIYGNSRGPASESNELKVPECTKPDSMGTIVAGKFNICDFSEKKYTEVVKKSPRTVPALQHQIMMDVFGTNAIKADGTLDATKICEPSGGFVKKGIDSLFAKSLTVGHGGSSNLTDSQAWIASILGTRFSRHLYRMNAEGKYLKADEFYSMASCGSLAELVRQRTQEVLNQIEGQAIVEIGNAYRKYSSLPKYEAVHKKIQTELVSLAERIKGNIENRTSPKKSTQQPDSKSEG